MAPSAVRRAAVLAGTALLAALLPLVATSGVADASVGCLTEKPGLLGSACDDENPPVTASATGSQTGAGQVTVTATASYTDGDTDPIGFECQLSGTATWGPCTISGLSPGNQKVAIRAVDTADLAYHPCVGLLCTGNEVPDYDATPANVTVAVTGSGGGGGPVPPPPSGPNGTPETQISGGPSDRITPGAPVTLGRRITVNLASSEPATFHCALNARKVPCKAGTNVLKHFKAGPQVFVAQAVDKDGNFDATPASLAFYVPINVSASQGKGWQKVKSSRSYAHDYVITRHRDAVLTLAEVSVIHELRLLAPTGPGFGKVAVRVGSGRWYKVRLSAKKGQVLKAFELRTADSPPASGRIQVKALKIPRGDAVAVDAIVAR